MPTPVDSPPELHLSLRAPSLPPGPSAADLIKQVHRSRAPLLRSLHPSALARSERPLTAALPPPLRSALAVSHDLDGLLRSDPSRGLPRVTLLGFLPSRVTPDSLRAPPSPTRPPLLALPRLLLLEQGRVASSCCLGAPPGAHSCEPTVSADFRFPFRRGPTPSWASSCGTSLPPPSPGSPRVHPLGLPSFSDCGRPAPSRFRIEKEQLCAR